MCCLEILRLFFLFAYIEVKKYAAVRLGAVDVLDAVHSALKGKSLLARLPYERANSLKVFFLSQLHKS